MNSTKFFNEQLPHIVGQVYKTHGVTKAFCKCPGSYLHTTVTAKNHTTAFWNNGKPWINCYHQSCQDVVRQTNLQLRKAYGDSKPVTQKTVAAQTIVENQLVVTARQHRSRILRDFRWPAMDIYKESPLDIEYHNEAQTLQHLALFEPDDVIWIGERRDTGKRWHKARFQRRDDWLNMRPPGNFICPSIFTSGTYSRSVANVSDRRFLVIESDALSKDEVGAIFKFLAQKLTLRAVVDTGNKSLHGWFDCPDKSDLDSLRLILPELGCDPKMFGAAQPARLAGLRRDNGKLQNLIYLNTEVVREN